MTNEGKSNESSTYYYTVIWEGSQNSIPINLFSDTELQFNRLIFNSPNDYYYHYYYFGKKTAEELEQFVKGPELLPGVWKSTLVEKRDIQADTTEALEEEYVLNVDAEGRYTSNIPQITNGAWYIYSYNPNSGHRYELMPDVSSSLGYVMTIHHDGKASIHYSDDSDYFSIYMEKDPS